MARNSFWCTSRKIAFEWFIPDLVASLHKIFLIEMDVAKRLGSKGAVVTNRYKPCCHQRFFLEKNTGCYFCLSCFFTFITDRLLRELAIQLCWDGHIICAKLQLVVFTIYAFGMTNYFHIKCFFLIRISLPMEVMNFMWWTIPLICYINTVLMFVMLWRTHLKETFLGLFQNHPSWFWILTNMSLLAVAVQKTYLTTTLMFLSKTM